MKNNGYIAIVSSLFLTFIVTTIVFITAANIFFGRTNTAIYKLKKNTRYLAESCLEHALLELADDRAYSGGETVAVDGFTCNIVSVTLSGDERIVRARATSTESVTNLELAVSSTTLEKVSLEEKQNF